MALTRSANTSTAKPSLLGRLKGNHHTTTTTTTTTTKHSTNPITGSHTTTTTKKVDVQKRKPTMGDKVSGAMMNLKGTVTGKPGVKGAGTRRMNGTDGKGSHYTRTY
ncbi:hypothetical protein M436DRAFT_40820 [Aureobasidium namibiae CBS 147.97]|uniref:Uncharacterized protein n=1 Tax=Aureobasidium namibiae CBS 147.97 TaxID=1043004 RepID=A0A074WUZ0_9PEZI|nr:uncharacterized protein M436DRAFT_40820 [Aureobasidium namibiae CBS 147.97]KEQ75369.1 hypothetical protein M436DRAFT_40820 [Aureobasidium namibiae CBS 147.97]